MNRPALAILIALALVAIASVAFLVRTVLVANRPETVPSVPTPQPYEAVIARALAGYNAHDMGALFAEFSKSAVPAPTEATQRSLFEGYYQQTFGNCMDRTLNAGKSEILPDRALLVWTATFSRAKPVTLSANFVTEGGTPKIVQLRFEKAE